MSSVPSSWVRCPRVLFLGSLTLSVATGGLAAQVCADPSSGRTPSLQVVDAPRLGQVFTVAVALGPAWSPCALLVSTRALTPGQAPPAPFDLPYCLVQVDPTQADTTWHLLDVFGNAQRSIGVPNHQALLGLTFHLQALPVTTLAAQLKLLASNPLLVTVRGPAVLSVVVENFDREAQLDAVRSAATWTAGACRFHAIGGDGRHGEFTPGLGASLGTIGGYDTWRIDTDLTIVPGSRTPSGQTLIVTDGRFFFTTMVVPPNVRIVFAGSVPPVLTVAGRLQVDGILDVAGEDLLPPAVPPGSLAPGQDGGRGGPFGGRGGQGGDRCPGAGPLASHAGRNGQDCRVLAGHAYAPLVVGTGGLGSPLFPAAGTTASIVFATNSNWCGMATSGGGGGGFRSAGLAGQAVTNSWPDPGTGQPPNPAFLGPATPGGRAFTWLPMPIGARSSQHFLIGGSGGGGGGSHPMLTGRQAPTFAPGGGGGGGGGAIALRAGRQLVLAAGAAVDAAGGAAGSAGSPTSEVVPAPGGGGSGGSIVLQSGGTMVADALLDVRGGAGGVQDRSAGTVVDGGSVRTIGGDGAPGQIRAELPAPSGVSLPNAQPPGAAVDTLNESDPLSSCLSLTYGSGAPDSPTWLRYELLAWIDGIPVLFSDDPAYGMPARQGMAPIAIWLQGVALDANGQPIPGSEAPWREQVGSYMGPLSLQTDQRNGFRFRLVFDRTTGSSVVVDRVAVYFSR